jgi:hypothetical protein
MLVLSVYKDLSPEDRAAYAESQRRTFTFARVVPLETLRRLAALLDEVEWAGMGGETYFGSCEHYDCCPRCEVRWEPGEQNAGHAPNCELAALKGILAGLVGP